MLNLGQYADSDANPTGGQNTPYECGYGHQETNDVTGRIKQKDLQPSVQDVMLAAIPSLRAFAMSLSGKFDRADDLVQGTLVRAMANIHSFKPETNMTAWLFTILHNLFRSEFRQRRREVEDTDGGYLGSMKSPPEQDSRVEFKELFAALTKVPLEQREALLLVGASGFSYEEAAVICATPVGTIKSRVNRARKQLAELLEPDSADKLGGRYRLHNPKFY
jgi:RNA polymerase sigma-70 factor, ECF subfamily